MGPFNWKNPSCTSPTFSQDASDSQKNVQDLPLQQQKMHSGTASSFVEALAPTIHDIPEIDRSVTTWLGWASTWNWQCLDYYLCSVVVNRLVFCRNAERKFALTSGLTPTEQIRCSVVNWSNCPNTRKQMILSVLLYFECTNSSKKTISGVSCNHSRRMTNDES